MAVYDDARIRERSEVIMYAIDARAQRFPDEDRFVYLPFAGEEDRYRWTPDTMSRLRDYNLLDLGI
jgi:hypothetical protein